MRATELRSRYGLLTSDSIIAATALGDGITQIASADPDFARVAELHVFRPADLD